MAVFKSLTYLLHAPSRQWDRFDKVVPCALEEKDEADGEREGNAYGLEREGGELVVTSFDGTDDGEWHCSPSRRVMQLT